MKALVATIVGLIASFAVNMGIIIVGTSRNPEKYKNQEDLIEAMKSLTTMDFMVPLAAHIFGVLAGFIVARWICKTSNIPIYIIFGLHMIGTTISLMSIPHPTWFALVDVIVPIVLFLYFLRTRKDA